MPWPLICAVNCLDRYTFVIPTVNREEKVAVSLLACFSLAALIKEQ